MSGDDNAAEGAPNMTPSTHAQIIDCSGKTRINSRVVHVSRIKVYIGKIIAGVLELEFAGSFRTMDAARAWVDSRGLILA